MNIWLVGGDHVIPTSVEKAIQGDGYTVKRISGEDRYETAAMVAEAGISLSGKKPSKVFVASGTSFADALAVSPVAFAKGYPIILTEKDSTSDFSKKELGNIGTDAKILVGGEAVVSKAVAANLSIKEDARVAGADRAVTANLVSDWAKKSEGFNPANAALVGGTNGNGADSLVAASLGGKSFTTLHFAGWDATATYFKDHSAELTGKGFVFGGKAAVSEGDVSKAQSAAQTVTADVAYTVTRDVDGAKLWYADPAKKDKVSVTLTSDDIFFVDGKKATIGVFQSALSAGDLVSWNKDSAGVITYKLTNKSASDYMSGMVGSVSGNSATINEPVANTTLNTISFASDTYRVFTIDGSAVSQSIFASSVSVGDSISVTGDGSSATNIQTVALKNANVSGVVAGWSAGNTTVGLILDSGAMVTVPVPSSSDTLSVDGKSTTTLTDVTGGLSNGDKVTYSKSGGVINFALTNAAPPAVKGQIQSVNVLNGRLVDLTYVDSKTHTALNPSNETVSVAYTTAATTYAAAVAGPPAVPARAQVDTVVLSASPWKNTGYMELEFDSGNVKEVAVGGNQATFMANLKAAIQAELTTRTVTVTQGADELHYNVSFDTAGGAATANSVDSVTALGSVAITVDGSLASATDLDTAITQGDVITYQAADVATGTKSSLDLANTGYSGSISATLVDTSTTKLGVYADGSTTVALGAALDYSANSVLDLSGTPSYTVNGVSKTMAEFSKALDSVKAGGATGTVKVSKSGTKLVWALTVSVS